MKIQGVDLFCGAGGLTHGMRAEGVEITHGIDTDTWCRFPYEANNDAFFHHRDIREMTAPELESFFRNDSVKLLAGCAPCQPFSNYVKADNNYKDSNWRLLYEFSRMIREIRPELVTMENVARIRKYEIYSHFLRELKELGYWVSDHVAYFPEYGLPQNRTRLILLASLYGPILFEPPKYENHEFKTVRDTISHLPPIGAGETSSTDKLHRSSHLSDKNLRRIRASKPGGTWHDWDETLVADCHTKDRGKSYKSVYGRMEWDKPSPTITTLCHGFGNGRFGHPEQDRALSLREAALLQTFPEYYAFDESDDYLPMKHVARMIGNAVPVDIGRVLGRSFKAHVRRYHDE